MRFNPVFTRSALALVIGAMAITAAPAEAQRKKKETAAATAGPPVSPGYLIEGRKVQAAFDAAFKSRKPGPLGTDGKPTLLPADPALVTTFGAALAAAEPFVTIPADRFQQGQFRLQYGIMANDLPTQAKALDEMLDSGLTPAADLARFNRFSGGVAFDNKDFPKAIARLNAAKAAGIPPREVNRLLVESYLGANQLDQALVAAREAITAERAAGQRLDDGTYVRVAQALQKANRRDELLDFLTMRVQDYPLQAVWRNTLSIMMRGSDEDLTLDTLRMMRHVGALTDRNEMLEYVGLATKGGLPGEVLAVISEARAKSAIPATDAKFDEIFVAQKARSAGDKAALDSDAAKGAALPNVKRMRGTADGLFGYGDHAKAATMYQIALDKGDPEPDLVTLRLGVSQFLSGNADAAKVTLAKVGGTRQRLARLWLLHIAAKTGTAPATTPTA